MPCGAVEIVGDDLYCTNPAIVERGISCKATNAMLLKVNQIGTISEAIAAYKLCVDQEWGVFVAIGLARRRTPSSPTSRWLSAPGTSRRAHRAAPSGCASTTS